ncbi:hypothetical protein [Salinirubrum litoreum]|uniref:Uncharacterized protein n=1 Tax=Salinirubrum litoreum TaxID=1126234 RepID=A0ABD5RAV8_9EURY|nr:hypothetical protein [Salinirubrum litoreum]
MSRRVPELALLTGVFLGLSLFVAGVLFTGDVPLTTLSAVVVCYPFAGYAVYHSPDPTTVLPPRIVAAAGVLVGAVAGLWALVGAGGADLLPVGLLAGFVVLVVALPPLAYAVAYGEEPLPIPASVALGAGTIAGIGFLVAGLLADAVFLASVNAVLAFLAGALYAGTRGLDPVRRFGRGVVLAGALLGTALVAGGVLVGPPEPWIVEGVAVSLATTVYYVAVVEMRS